MLTPDESGYQNVMPSSVFQGNNQINDSTLDPNKNVDAEIVLPIVKSPIN